MLILTAVFVSCTSALGAALLGNWLNTRRLQTAQSIPLIQHGGEMQSLRRHYRRRFRALRDTLDETRREAERLETRLGAAEVEREEAAIQLASARHEVSALRQRIGDMEAQQHEQRQVIERLQHHERTLGAHLTEAREKIAAFENDHGLLRIERDELVARTQRLRALSASPAAEPAPEAAESAASVGGASRAELAERNARIHELECQLRRSRGRLRELKAELQTWKYRIAPLALHLKMQRDKASAEADGPADNPANDATKDPAKGKMQRSDVA
jgi:chromosome segregation ATPase